MKEESILKGTRVLVVDDEPDVLELVRDALDMCEVDTALDFETAKASLETRHYDAAILDIMGVRGYDLLEISISKNIPTLMLSAHALSPEHLMKSINRGAVSYIPKEKIPDIARYLSSALGVPRGISAWEGAWFARLRPYFYKKFGADWRNRSENLFLEFESVESILVPTDFSAYSCDAFSWAAFVARKFKARVIILHVISEKHAEELIGIPGNPWETVLAREERQMIEDFSACLVGDFGIGVEKETVVAVGSPASKIVEVARERGVGMVVMSTHGKTGISRVLAGSTAAKVMGQAPCPVLSVRPKELG